MSVDRKEKIQTSSNRFKNSSSKVPKNVIGIFLLIAISSAFLYSCNISGSDDENPPSNQNTAPVAELSYSPSNPATGDNITFDGSSSSDADGEITNYRWDLDGDGNVDESSSSPTTTHTYSNTGDVTVSLEVVDDNEASDEDTVTVTVSSSNSAPSADFTYSPSNPKAGETVTFDGSGSSDPDGVISSYKWDYDGDGNFDHTTQTATVNTSFSSEGNYDVTLKVIDDEQASDEVTKTISVAGNSAPLADFTYSPSSPQAGETVTFDASGSSDPDGVITNYMWDYDGDGNYDQTTQMATVNTSFSSEGNYDVTLKVVDDEQASDQVTKTISVAGNSAPSADFEYSPSNPKAGETVTFDASGSSDPDGVISSYKWDYDGDGNFDHTTQTATVNTSFSGGGNYDVTLKVVDDEEASDQVTQTISVTGNSAPSADFEYSPSSPSVGEDVTLDASASDDPDGTVVYYSWDFDGDGNYDRTSENPATVTSYSEAGSYDVKLKIIDDEEAEATVTKTISVGT